MKKHAITLAAAGALIATGLLAPISTARLGAQDTPKKEKTAKKEQRKDTGKSQDQHKDKSAKKK